MFCYNCGTELPEGAKFCFKCGKTVADNKGIVHKKAREAVRERKKNKKILIAALAVIVVLFVVQSLTGGIGSSGSSSSSSSSSGGSSYSIFDHDYEPQKVLDCFTCGGDGDCPKCNGYGTQSNYAGAGDYVDSVCSRCYGGRKCPTCGGSGKR